MKIESFMRKSMRFGAIAGLIAGTLLAMALYAKSDRMIVLIFVPFAVFVGWCSPYLMHRIDKDG